MSPTTQNLSGGLHETRDAVRESGRTLKHETGKLAHEARDLGRQFAEQQKDEAASFVHDLAAAAESSAEHLSKHGRPASARFIHSTAGQIDEWAEGLRAREAAEILGDVEDFARRRPLLFFGAAFALGFGLARFARSGEEHPDGPGHSPGDGRWAAPYGAD